MKSIYREHSVSRMVAFAIHSASSSGGGSEAAAEYMFDYLLCFPDFRQAVWKALDPHCSCADDTSAFSAERQVGFTYGPMKKNGVVDVRLMHKCANEPGARTIFLELKIDAALTTAQKSPEYWQGTAANTLVYRSQPHGIPDRGRTEITQLTWEEFGDRIWDQMPDQLGEPNLLHELLATLVGYCLQVEWAGLPTIGELGALSDKKVRKALWGLPYLADQVATAFDFDPPKFVSPSRAYPQWRGKSRNGRKQWVLDVDPSLRVANAEGHEVLWPFTFADGAGRRIPVPMPDEDLSAAQEAAAHLRDQVAAVPENLSRDLANWTVDPLPAPASRDWQLSDAIARMAEAIAGVLDAEQNDHPVSPVEPGADLEEAVWTLTDLLEGYASLPNPSDSTPLPDADPVTGVAAAGEVLWTVLWEVGKDYLRTHKGARLGWVWTDRKSKSISLKMKPSPADGHVILELTLGKTGLTASWGQQPIRSSDYGSVDEFVSNVIRTRYRLPHPA